MNILEKIEKGLCYFDGGMGTLLQAQGLKPGELPEMWNLLHPGVVEQIHREYFAAGSNIVCSNTFGANSFKFTGTGESPSLDAVVKAGMSIARRAKNAFSGDRYVALDVGPLGKMLEPYGSLPFEEAVERFAQVIRAGAPDADLVLIETMNDSYETKAAVLAAKENCSLPVFVSCVYDERGKLMTGADIPAMVSLLEGLGADAIGMNCSLGPLQMLQLVPEFEKYCSVPIIVNPNAGLPRSENGRTVYDIDAEQFACAMAEIVRRGARIIGGCCGTTPEYISAAAAATKDITPLPITEKSFSSVSSYTHSVFIGGAPVLIGERINPTGKKRLKQALLENDISYILGQGIAQQECGAHILDVNVGLPGTDETSSMVSAVKGLQSVCSLPLQIDSSNPKTMEAALRCYNGKAMINSVNGKSESMDAVFPLAAKYGGMVVCLTLDEDGIPSTAAGRLSIARKIKDRAAEYGIKARDLIFDPLALAVSAQPEAALVTLDSIRLIRSELGCCCSLGVSNVSYGLPERELINTAFFSMALYSGLSAAIMNPCSAGMMNTYRAFMAISGLDSGCEGYISFAQGLSAGKNAPAPQNDAALSLTEAIVHGLKDKARELTLALLKDEKPLDIINEKIIPALDIAGKGFEEKTVYLPQLLMSAEAASEAFAAVRDAMPGSGSSGPTIVLATVKGDIHDIGKNIVKVLLENYGYRVADLGKDVPPEKVLEAVLREKAPLAGLSALMTTTVPAMEETIKLLHEKAPFCRVIAGGAVLTQDYADAIGADAYAKTAMDAVRCAEKLLGC